jgi:hypothetical protein
MLRIRIGLIVQGALGSSRLEFVAEKEHHLNVRPCNIFD